MMKRAGIPPFGLCRQNDPAGGSFAPLRMSADTSQEKAGLGFPNPACFCGRLLHGYFIWSKISVFLNGIAGADCMARPGIVA